MHIHIEKNAHWQFGVSKMGGQRSEVRGQKSEVRGLRLEV